jgi:hypothetical protein
MQCGEAIVRDVERYHVSTDLSVRRRRVGCTWFPVCQGLSVIILQMKGKRIMRTWTMAQVLMASLPDTGVIGGRQIGVMDDFPIEPELTSFVHVMVP